MAICRYCGAPDWDWQKAYCLNCGEQAPPIVFSLQAFLSGPWPWLIAIAGAIALAVIVISR